MAPLEEFIDGENQDGYAPEYFYMEVDLPILYSKYGFEVWDYNDRKAFQMPETMRVLPLECVLQVVLRTEFRDVKEYFQLWKSPHYTDRTQAGINERINRGLAVPRHDYHTNGPQTMQWNPANGWNLRAYGKCRYEKLQKEDRS